MVCNDALHDVYIIQKIVRKAYGFELRNLVR